MIKRKLEKDLIHYQFAPKKEADPGANLYALCHGQEVLLLDGGYQHHMEEVIKDLADKKIVGVIPTHYHPDHVDGILLLENVEIYGNHNSLHSLKTYMPEEEERLAPTQLVDEKTQLSFGDFRLGFQLLPGHSDCSMIIFINDRYVHLGDLYMTLNDGMDVLPFVAWKNVGLHIKALEEAKQLSGAFLLSHGKTPLNKEDVLIGLQDRISYLQALLDSDNQCLVSEAIKNTQKPFACQHWRDYVK